MNDLHFHSLASYTYASSQGWDYHNLGVLNVDKMSLMPAMEESTTPHEHSDFSTGYLEDALIQSCERSKRRRLLPFDIDEHSKSFFDDLEQNFWNFNPIWHQPLENFNFYCMNQIECGFSDEKLSTLRGRISEEENNVVAEIKTPEETIISGTDQSPNSCSSSYKQAVTSKLLGTDPTVGTAGSGSEKKKALNRRKVVYPFAMVKPGGREGEVTLSEINERILMPPTRPVRHPVGDFACRPCVSTEGPGLSGKAVVALTRIHTLGRRGTITIIRTKG